LDGNSEGTDRYGHWRVSSATLIKLQRQQRVADLARDWLKEGETLAPYIDRQVALLKSRLQGLRLLARRAERLGPEADGRLGECIDTAYRNGAKIVFQRQAAFIVAPGRVLIFTASNAKSFNDTFDTFWRTWLDGYRPAEQASA